MDRELIGKTESFLRDKLAGGAYMAAHPAELRYRLEHSFRVANICLLIARREGFEETEAVMAGLLHDIAYCEEFGETGWKEHGRRSAAIARPFLRSLGLREDRVGDICYGIAIHVDDEADFPGERTPFALSVGDADNIDRFDVYRIHETLSRDGFLSMSLSEQRRTVEERLRRLRSLYDMELGTRAAAELWRERLDFTVAFFEKLAAQLASSENVIDA